ncbi:hypothetical protein [Nitrosomonas supralitoralis]|uniref:hypothetical protein n=1 Tax=Nitrosomonas supralitoralis TaxID=2116706 RepID=UPI001559CECE|nr:hypothetical protein [Nitrosomonas supralitoralis]
MADADDDRMLGRGEADVFPGNAGEENMLVHALDFKIADGSSGSDIFAVEKQQLGWL